ncbi:hypothetical protein CRENBAI_000946 [Crenichthys baileyi]|uniref:Helix-turn-helix domain-containing protein n=1 Tax=Crenichthys baileyi TaxID=28760 RepID=A0AAV9R619_9TELE
MSKLSSISPFPFLAPCDSVTQGLWCVNFGVIALSYWSLEVQPGYLWQRSLRGSEKKKKTIAALHKDGQGYKTIGDTLKLSSNTLAETIQQFNRTGFHSEQASPWSTKDAECTCSMAGVPEGSLF